MTSESVAIMIAVIGLTVQMIAMLVSMLWTFGKINAKAESHFARFDTSIDHLTGAVSKVSTVVEKLHETIDDYGQRLAVVEHELSHATRRARVQNISDEPS